MSSLDQAKADLEARGDVATASPAVTQITHTVYVGSGDELSALVDRVEAGISDGAYYSKAVVNAQPTPDGSPSVVWAWRRRKRGKRGQANYLPTIMVTAYASGAVVFQGYNPEGLPAAA